MNDALRETYQSDVSSFTPAAATCTCLMPSQQRSPPQLPLCTAEEALLKGCIGWPLHSDLHQPPILELPLFLQVQKFRKDGHAYDGQPVSRWNGVSEENRAVFVDETRYFLLSRLATCLPARMPEVQTRHLSANVW